MEERDFDWLKNSSFNAIKFPKHSAQHDAELSRHNLLALAESSSDDGSQSPKKHVFKAAKSRKRHRDGKSKEKHKKSSRHKVKGAGQGARFIWAEDVANGQESLYCQDMGKVADNLVYQKMYVYDKPAFRRCIPSIAWALALVLDGDSQTGPKRKRIRRFTSRAFKSRESDVNRAKWFIIPSPHEEKLPSRNGLNLALPAYIPVEEEQFGNSLEARRQSESEAMRRRIITYNRATVEEPGNLQNWLDFAAFQDELESFLAGPSSSASAKTKRSVAEKKVDILQKALKYHPEAPEVVCKLIEATKVFEDLTETAARFENAVRSPAFAKAPALWRQYIDFSLQELLASNRGLNSLTEIFDTYHRALQALKSERLRLLSLQDMLAVLSIEVHLIDLLLDFCRVALHSGHTELAISQLQACIEFAVLGPNWSTAVPGPGGDHVRLPLFEDYWKSGTALIGEQGCTGWQSWALSHQNPNIPPPPPPPDPADLEPGGWSGWKELEIEAEEVMPDADAQKEASPDSDDEDVDADATSEEDEEQRLSRLLEEEAAKLQSGPSLPANILEAWIATERRRERCEWQPKRLPGHRGLEENRAEDMEEAEDVNKPHAVYFEDIKRGLFSVSNLEHMRRLVFGLLKLLDVPLEHEGTSNSGTVLHTWNSRLALPPDLWPWILGSGSRAEEVEKELEWLSPNHAESLHCPIAAQLQWFQADESRHTFVRRALELLLSNGRLNMNHQLCEALVKVTAADFLIHPQDTDEIDELPETENADLGVFEDRGQKNESKESSQEVQVGRVEDLRGSLANLLQAHSDGSALWTAYASYEMLHRNAKRARKSFDAYLINLSQAQGSKLLAAPIALEYAKTELARAAKNSQQSAQHVLSWLACGRSPYLPLTDQPTSSLPSVGEVRSGFQDAIFSMIAHKHDGMSREEGALLLSAALYEQIIDESSANGPRILRNAVAEFPPAVRRISKVLEDVTIQACRMLTDLLDAHKLPPGPVRSMIQSGLQDYPRSPALVSMLAHVEQRAFLMTRLRVDLRERCEEQDSVLLWILTARIEHSITQSPAKMQQIFKLASKSEGVTHSAIWQRACFAFSLLYGRDNMDLAFAQMTDNCPWVKDAWIDGLKFEGNHSYRLAEAEKRDVRLRTSLNEIIYSIAGQRIETLDL